MFLFFPAFLSAQELKLPTYRAHSPQIGMRRYFADLLAVLSNRYQLCPTARHLAVYLLDLFMDQYDVAVRQLYVIALSCLLLASKFPGGNFSLSFLWKLFFSVNLYSYKVLICSSIKFFRLSPALHALVFATLGFNYKFCNIGMLFCVVAAMPTTRGSSIPMKTMDCTRL